MHNKKHQKRQARKKTVLLAILTIFLGLGVTTSWYLLLLSDTIKPVADQEPATVVNLTASEKKTATEMDQLLKKSKYIGTIYVRKNNRIILEKTYGYADKETNQPNSLSLDYQIGSIQKAMTALLILKQIEQKKISFTTPLATFYPQIPGSQSITIHDLLTMRSGLHKTEQPSVPLTDRDIVQFTVEHLKWTDYQTYHYEPLNFTLLAGILMQLTNKSYEELLSDSLIKPLQLQHTDFYENVKNSPQHAKSYQMSADDDYWKELDENETAIHNELGTGNISMNTYDLAAFFTKVLSGQLIPKKLLFSLWQNNQLKHPYSGGVYSGADYILAQGNINRFHSVVAMTKDTKNAIVMQSNIQSDTKIKPGAVAIRNQLYEILTGKKLPS